MKKTPKILLLLLGLGLVLFGVFVFLYPIVSSHMAQQHQLEVTEHYEKRVETAQDRELQQAREEAQAYNASLAGDPVRDPFIPGSGYALPDNYTQMLNLDGDGIMGTLEIPKIGVRLPIGHGTDEEVLLKNVGHIESTALPIGGEGTHAVLTGHRGLPSAELLTRLDEMEIGDLFYLRILDQVLAYRVDQITTVLPYELENLQAEPGRDLVTVLTCTPYGINTHRLLVRGQRTQYIPEEMEGSFLEAIPYAGINMRRLVQGTLLGLALLAVLLVLFLLIHVLRKRRRRGRYSK